MKFHAFNFFKQWVSVSALTILVQLATGTLLAAPENRMSDQDILTNHVQFCQKLLNGTTYMEIVESADYRGLSRQATVQAKHLTGARNVTETTYDMKTSRFHQIWFSGNRFRIETSQRINREAGDGTAIVSGAFNGTHFTSWNEFIPDNTLEGSLPTYSKSTPRSSSHFPGYHRFADKRFLLFPGLHDFATEDGNLTLKTEDHLSSQRITTFAKLHGERIKNLYHFDSVTGQLVLQERADASSDEPAFQIMYEYAAPEDRMPVRVVFESRTPDHPRYRKDEFEILYFEEESTSARALTTTDFEVGPPSSSRDYVLWNSAEGRTARVTR